MTQLLLSGHLYPFEGSQVADQWLQGVNVDGFAIFVPEAAQLGTRIQEEKLEPDYQPNPLTLSQLSLLVGTYTCRLLASECQKRGISRRERDCIRTNIKHSKFKDWLSIEIMSKRNEKENTEKKIIMRRTSSTWMIKNQQTHTERQTLASHYYNMKSITKNMKVQTTEGENYDFFTLVRWEGGERKDREWKFCASSWGDLRAPPVVEVEGIETDNTSLAAPPLICCIFLFPRLYFYQIQKVDGRRYWEPFWWWYWREIVVVELCMITGGWGYFLKNLFLKIILK